MLYIFVFNLINFIKKFKFKLKSKFFQNVFYFFFKKNNIIKNIDFIFKF